jgi:hypothetical protein
MLYFGYVAQWESFRGAVISNQLYGQDDPSLPREVVFFTRFAAADYGLVWMLIKGYINQVCGETPNDFRMEVPAPSTNFASHELTMIETQRKAAIYVPYQSGQDANKLAAEWEMQPPRFVTLCINANTYNVVV